MNYEQYYQKGGTYVIPTEVFNELIDENKHLKDLQKSMDKQYSKLEHKWNELKKWLEEEKSKQHHTTHWDMLDKIKELEEGGNNE